MRKKIDTPSPSSNSPELKAIMDRLKRKEPELAEVVRRSRKKKRTKPEGK